MVIDNKKTTIRIYLFKMIQATVTVILLIGIMVSGWFERDVLGISKYQWIITGHPDLSGNDNSGKASPVELLLLQ